MTLKILKFCSAAACALLAMNVSAATVTFQYTESFGAVTPDGPSPYATATFDDAGSAGSVTLTMQVASTVGAADVTEMYYNLNPSIDPTALSFTRVGGTGPLEVFVRTGRDQFRAGGDGFYDILFEMPPPPGSLDGRFNAGEDLVFSIEFPGLTASDFNLFGAPGGGLGPYLSVARFQSTGPDQNGSDLVGAVPVPAAVWLFGSGLIGLVGIAARRKRA